MARSSVGVTLLLVRTGMVLAQVPWAGVAFDNPTGGSNGLCANGQDSTQLRHEERWLTSESECLATCEASARCLAYEFSSLSPDHRGYQRCKLFAQPVTRSQSHSGVTCQIKVVKSAGASAGGGAAAGQHTGQLPAVVSTAWQTPPPPPPGPTSGDAPALSPSVSQRASPAANGAPPASPASHHVKSRASEQGSTKHPDCVDVVLNRACACCHGLGPGVDVNVVGCTDLKGADLRGVDLDSAVCFPEPGLPAPLPSPLHIVYTVYFLRTLYQDGLHKMGVPLPIHAMSLGGLAATWPAR